MRNSLALSLQKLGTQQQVHSLILVYQPDLLLISSVCAEFEEETDFCADDGNFFEDTLDGQQVRPAVTALEDFLQSDFFNKYKVSKDSFIFQL